MVRTSFAGYSTDACAAVVTVGVPDAGVSAPAGAIAPPGMNCGGICSSACAS